MSKLLPWPLKCFVANLIKNRPVNLEDDCPNTFLLMFFMITLNLRVKITCLNYWDGPFHIEVKVWFVYQKRFLNYDVLILSQQRGFCGPLPPVNPLTNILAHKFCPCIWSTYILNLVKFFRVKIFRKNL